MLAKMVASLAILGSLLVPTAADAGHGPAGEQEQIYSYWNMDGNRVWNLDARFRVVDSANQKFYSQTFDFTTGGGGYMGLQQKSGNGDRVAIFSMWADGTSGSATVGHTGHRNCQADPGRENGGGIQCFLDFDWTPNVTYTVRVWRLSTGIRSDTWGAWVIDDRGREQQIGTISISTPPGADSLINHTNTFVEDFANIHDCKAPSRTVLRVSKPNFNGNRGSASFNGTNGGSACADGSVVQVSSSAHPSWEMGLGTGAINSGGISGRAGKCLDVRGPSTKNGTPVQVWDCVGVANQKWEFRSNGEIRGYGNKCLDVRGPSTADGTAVQIWDCVGVANQKWQRNEGGEIIGYGGKCLTMAGGATNNGTPTEMKTCANEGGQRWLRK